jgi:hypothetical protein
MKFSLRIMKLALISCKEMKGENDVFHAPHACPKIMQILSKTFPRMIYIKTEFPGDNVNWFVLCNRKILSIHPILLLPNAVSYKNWLI